MTYLSDAIQAMKDLDDEEVTILIDQIMQRHRGLIRWDIAGEVTMNND